MCRLVERAQRAWLLLMVLYDHESEKINHFGQESNDEKSKSSTNRAEGIAIDEELNHRIDIDTVILIELM